MSDVERFTLNGRGPSRWATRSLLTTICALMVIVACGSSIGWAAGTASVRGAVVDALGARVAGAAVTLMRDGDRIAEGTSDARGEFVFEAVDEGRYRLEVTASGFETRTTDPLYLGPSAHLATEITLKIGSLEQYVSVTAAATTTPVAQTGAAVTVIDRSTLQTVGAHDVFQALQLVPGTLVVQAGQRGAGTSLFVRGGNSNFNKVLIDGVVANDIGGFVDFGGLTTAGVERVEVLRESNSVLYGSDALTGVVSIVTRRGRTRVPEASYAIDGGSLSTLSTSVSAGGAVKRFDYFSEYSYADTANNTANGDYRNATYAGRFGVVLGGATDLSGTIRRAAVKAGRPNSVGFYGVADDLQQKDTATYASLTLASQMTDRWQTTVRFGSSDQTSRYENPSPTGEPFDPFGFGANYLGDLVTIRGGNGFSVTGQAILDFGGAYPSVFESRTTRRTLSGQTSYQITDNLDVSAGARFEHEAAFDDPESDPSATRDNGGLFVEARGVIGQRHHLSAGLGYEHHAVFESAITPRVSIASYLRNPSSAALSDTKLVFNAGTGVKAPSVFQQENSLSGLLASVAGAPTVPPVGPERSRTVDLGVEQGLWGGQARVRVSYFHNDFSDFLEYVGTTALPQVGIPLEVAVAAPFGAYVNSQSFRTRGVETSADAVFAGGFRFSASYTYLDAKVTKSFSGDALAPAINPQFPTTPIGAISPLVGQRPFRRPTHSGNLLVSYERGPAQVALVGFFVGARDDSTYLTDGFFGNSLLLPNRDLDASYRTFDLNGAYRVHARLRGYVQVQNLTDRRYAATIGFPSLPRTFRAGVSVGLGGDR